MAILNKIPVEVYKLINVVPESKDKEWIGGIKRFYGLTYADLEKIVEILGKDFSEYQNEYRPSVSSLLSNLVEHKEVTSFGGYIVSPNRSDERLVIDAMSTKLTEEVVSLYRDTSNGLIKGDNRVSVWWE